MIKFKNIALTGATGYVGGRLLNLLQKNGYAVRCLTRDPQHLLDQFPQAKIEIVQADALNKLTLSKAFEGIDCAYYFVHSMGGKDDFLEKDRLAAKNFAEEASKAGIKRIIYLGGLGDSQQDLSTHLKSRQEVGQILRDNAPNVEIVEFRASIVIGSGSISFEMIRALCERLPVMITPKWVKTLLQPIAINDLLKYLLEALNLEDLPHYTIFEIGGKDQVSYQILMEEYSRQRGLKRLMVPVPVLSPRISSLWLGLVTPLYATVGKKLIESAFYPTVVNDDKAKKYFKIEPVGYQEAIASALRYEDQKFAETRWIDSLLFYKRPYYLDQQNQINWFKDVKSLTVYASAEKVYEKIEQIGGETGYYYGYPLWWLRGFLDLLVGGVGLRRGRRDPNKLRVGDTVDFWRVEAVEPNQRLLLRAEMKLPGRAWLEYKVEGYRDLSIVQQTAYFDPKGLSGLLYWYLAYPFHRFIFVGMLRGIAKAAMSDQPDAAKTANHEHFMKKTLINSSAPELFSWYATPSAFQRLVPPWMDVKIIKAGQGLEKGSEVIIKITKGFLSFQWHLKHIDYVKDKLFRDKQVKGPFNFWEHSHIFEQLDHEKTLMVDSIEYQLPGGKIGKSLFGSYFYQDLEKLFKYRHNIIKNDLSIHRSYQGKTMKILIAGASGLIGKELCSFLSNGRHQVLKLTRKQLNLDSDEISWDPHHGIIDPNRLEGFDAVINLAGESIAQRWNQEVKNKIVDSRINSTLLLSKTLASLSSPPKVFINASAVGFYGNRGDEELTEQSAKGEGFLSDVCQKWEEATVAAKEKGIRVVLLRTGIVLSPKGGALAQMSLPFKLGLGGVIGDGKQYWSWIAIDDAIGIIHYALTNEALVGPINNVSPEPVTCYKFTKTLGNVLNRPTILPMPKTLARLAFGEAADEMLLASERVKPEKLIKSNYQFLYPNLEGALRNLLGK